jgi:ubiquinone/menaquinone biosynthesis C-methylase UbiE
MAKRPDWQLPRGVTRGIWQYTQSDELARGYDASLSGSSLPTIDCQFVQCHCAKPGKLIDLGCGTGRLSIAMATLGHRCLGVDLSAAMLRVTAEKAKAAGVHIDLLQSNLVELQCLDDARFDYAACLFSTLGMIGSPEARRQVLAHAYRLLVPGGVLVLHVHNRWFNVWGPGRLSSLAADLIRQCTGRRGAGDRHMPGHGDVPPMTLHLFTRGEIVRLLRGAGFAVRQVKPISLAEDGKLRWPSWFGWLRAYGYILAAIKPVNQLH